MATLRGDITTRRPSSLRGEDELTGKVADSRLTIGIIALVLKFEKRNWRPAEPGLGS